MVVDDKYVCKLSSAMQEIATKELGENPARRDADIQAIREWIKQNPYLHADTSARSILSFLRVCKFSLEKTKERLDRYYTVRTAAPEFYAKFDPLLPEIQTVLKAGLFLPLLKPDKEGRRVLLVRHGVLEPNKVKLEDVFKTSNMIIAILQDEYEELQITGQVMIQDHKKTTSAHLSLINLAVLKKGIKCRQDTTPMRMKGIHAINTSGVFQTMINMLKPILKDKLNKRMQVHGDNLETLYAHIPKEILPKEYGGTEGKVADLVDYWKKKVESRRSWLLEQEKYKTEENKRPGPKRDLNAELFGMEGSFRKLEID